MENKSFCEDLTEGKFSFPIIHSISADPSDTKLLSLIVVVYIVEILKQKTEDVDLKKYALSIMEKTKSFEYTEKVIEEHKEQVLKLITELGGNPYLLKLVETLMKQQQ